MTCDSDAKDENYIPVSSPESPITSPSSVSDSGRSFDDHIVTGRRKPYINPSASTWESNQASTADTLAFHQGFPTYTPTRLVSLPSIAKELGVGAVHIKEESQRCGLPSFKILGASWAICRALAAYTHLSVDTDIQVLAEKAKARNVVLVAATKGNHGRAVAKAAKFLGLKARILVPVGLCEKTIEFIRGEGADVMVTRVDYDGTVILARKVSQEMEAGILIQDTAFEGYEEIPQV